jgi:hypothetical protein
MKDIVEIFHDNLLIAKITWALPNTTSITVDDAFKFTVKEWLELNRNNLHDRLMNPYEKGFVDYEYSKLLEQLK